MLNRAKRPEHLERLDHAALTPAAARAAAVADLRAGVLVIPWTGLTLDESFGTMLDLLTERYGIQWWGMGDVITEPIGVIEDDYGGYARGEAVRCFGADVFERHRAEAKALTRARMVLPYEDWLNEDSVRAAVSDVARTRGLRGRVILRVTPGTRGAFERVEVIRSDDPTLDSVAIRLILRSRLRVLPDTAPPQATWTFPVRFGARSR